MKTFQLITDQTTVNAEILNFKNAPVIAVIPTAVEDEAVIGLKTKTGWFDKDAPQNLTSKGAMIRAILVITLPGAYALQWYYNLPIIYVLAPVLFYLEVTALTMTCPIKALFSNYRHKNLPEL
ncbi:MAG: hypothetical protein EOP33_06770 [Rickettsiaceae bacterium]|jgi:hypothetical protein|nr:MAG: hypothetical protein EOP33_06770 [Rickettsiaceae bacterium]